MKKKRSTPYRVIGMVGSRHRNSEDDYDLLRHEFALTFRAGDRIVSGGCPKGADRFAEKLAKDWQCSITIHYANWDLHGKVAGFVRNSLIAEDCDILIALPASDHKGGTEDTIRKVKKLGKKVIIV